jgi:16S rRNA processing protein RimM
MTAGAGDRATGSKVGGSHVVSAGRVGRAHGLDGSFYVTGARPRLLTLGMDLVVAGRTAKVLRRAGTDAHPIVRLEGTESRGAAEALRGLELTADQAHAPALGEGEWWAGELEGCEVVDGDRHVGIVVRLLELPSCEALEVRLAMPEIDGADESAGRQRAGKRDGDLLVPMVRDAIRGVDVRARRIDVDMSFLEDV